MYHFAFTDNVVAVFDTDDPYEEVGNYRPRCIDLRVTSPDGRGR